MLFARRPSLKLLCLGLALASLTACGGGDDDKALSTDVSTDVVAKYIGSWKSDCYKDSGASALLRADFTKVSATSFTGKVVAYGYIGNSCSGPSIKDENVLTNLQMTHAGTKTTAGVLADKFTGSSSQGTSKVLLSGDGTQILIGDPDSGKDAEGFPSQFFEYKFRRL
jgi:hypothetical protein